MEFEDIAPGFYWIRRKDGVDDVVLIDGGIRKSSAGYEYRHVYYAGFEMPDILISAEIKGRPIPHDAILLNQIIARIEPPE